jgi:hypothetical protein
MLMNIPFSEVLVENRRITNRDRRMESLHNIQLHLVNVWWHEGRRMARWSQASRKLLLATLLLLRGRMKTVLSRYYTHVKGRRWGQRHRWLARQVGDFRFAARFDIASHYDSMQHNVLLNMLVQTGMEEPLCALVRQYLENYPTFEPHRTRHDSSPRCWAPFICFPWISQWSGL